jgi:hypothetical protein
VEIEFGPRELAGHIVDRGPWPHVRAETFGSPATRELRRAAGKLRRTAGQISRRGWGRRVLAGATVVVCILVRSCGTGGSGVMGLAAAASSTKRPQSVLEAGWCRIDRSRAGLVRPVQTGMWLTAIERG